MGSEKIYVPILKWKTGEKEALKNLTEKQKNAIFPTLEIIEYENPSAIIEDINNYYGQPVCIDTSYVDEGERGYLISIIEKSRNTNTKISPLLYYEDFYEIADSLCSLTERIVVKIPVPEDIEGEAYSTIFETLKRWSSENNVILDLMLDLGLIEGKNQANLLYSELKSVLNNYVLNDRMMFNKIIIAMTSFPSNLSTIPAGESVFIDRYDKKIFQKLINNPVFSHLKNQLIYSDYGVTKFTDSELDFSKLRHGILPKAKYTIPEKYWILKGKKDQVTKKMVINHTILAKEIYESDHYYGEDFSFGDKDIKLRATEEKGPGNSTQWVTIAATHHIAVVVEELSKVYVP